MLPTWVNARKWTPVNALWGNPGPPRERTDQLTINGTYLPRRFTEVNDGQKYGTTPLRYVVGFHQGDAGETARTADDGSVVARREGGDDN